MSFPIDIDDPEATPRELGDIFICPKTALIYTKDTPHLFWEELTFYLVHGLLHLLGYEDTSSEKRSVMHLKERALLRALKKTTTLLSGDFRG